MNESIELARDVSTPSGEYFDSKKKLKEMICINIPVVVYGTYERHAGRHQSQSCSEAAQEEKITELAQWIQKADKVISIN
jgi:hypothetical protein